MTDALPAALWLMTLQLLLGGFDNLWHHEITQRLPSKPWARQELALHAGRELLYAPIFLAFAFWQPSGAWAWGLIGLIGLELVITLADFVVEDKTRKLPALERVLHTLMALNIGAVLALILPALLSAAGEETALVYEDRGLFAWLFSAAALGVFLWGLRNGLAVYHLGKEVTPLWQRAPLVIAKKAAPQHYLVTGATGFIGRHLVRALLARGDQVSVWVRDEEKAQHLFGPQARIVTDLRALGNDSRIDGLINLAGAPVLGVPWFGFRRRQLLASRLETTRQLVSLAARLQHKPQVMINASAVGYYGRCGVEPLDESAPAQPGVFISDLCFAWEKEATHIQALGLRLLRLRIGLVLDDTGGILPRLMAPLRFGLMPIFGTGQQIMSWIALEDLLAMTLHLLDSKDAEGAVNATAPGALDQTSVMKLLRRHCGAAMTIKLPAWPMRVMMGEMSDLLLSGQRAVPTAAYRLGFHFRFNDLDAYLASKQPQAKGRIQVFYDDACPVCAREMAHYHKRMVRAGVGEIAFIGLSNADHNLPAGYSRAALLRNLTCLDEKGQVFSGTEAFAAIYQRVPGFGWAARWLRHPWIKAVVGFVYARMIVPLVLVLPKMKQPWLLRELPR